MGFTAVDVPGWASRKVVTGGVSEEWETTPLLNRKFELDMALRHLAGVNDAVQKRCSHCFPKRQQHDVSC